MEFDVRWLNDSMAGQGCWGNSEGLSITNRQ